MAADNTVLTSFWTFLSFMALRGIAAVAMTRDPTDIVGVLTSAHSDQQKIAVPEIKSGHGNGAEE